MLDAAKDWSAVATAWDENADEVDDRSEPATVALLEALAVTEGERLLELAAGPGTLAATWSGLVGPHGSVVLSDVAPGMVERARPRTAGLANVSCAVLDASAIDAADASFDVVACRMGLMFTPEPAAAFREIRRVLAPGGRFGALTWGLPEHNPWIACVGMAAMANGIVAGGPPVGPGGIFSLGDPAACERLAVDADFADVRVSEIDVVFHAPDLDAHLERVLALAGPLARAYEAAPPEQQAAVRRTAAELAAPHVHDGVVRLPGRAVLTTGRVPA